jgi:citrate lyase subunit beta/citryl-CoA lyase
MVAGDKEKQLRKIPYLECDVAMINLEDGVFDKKVALDLTISIFKELNLKKYKKIVIRVNGVQEGGLDEIKALNSLKPYAIRVAKIKSVDEIDRILKILDKDIELHLSIETKEIFQYLNKLGQYNQVTTLYLGILDLLESLNLSQDLVTINNPTIDYILSKFLIESKIINKNPVGFMYQDYNNLKMYEKWCNKLKAMGYKSASCLSPKQVLIANEIFRTDETKVKKALYIKEIFEKNKAEGITGFSDEKYGFIDEPIYKDALLQLNVKQ